MKFSGPTVIHWFRRDLRLADNPSLLAAAGSGMPVVPVYVASRWHGRHLWTGAHRQQFLCESIGALAADLAGRGGRLIVRRGDPHEEIPRLLRECRAVAVHCNGSPDPHGKRVEEQIRRACRELAVDFHVHADVALHGPDEVLTQGGQPYRVFTPYCRNWLALPKPAPAGKPRHLATPPAIRSLPLPTLADWGLPPAPAPLPPAGEAAAWKRLRHALRKVLPTYQATRDFPAIPGTSRLSQDLRFGLLSIRNVHAAAAAAMAGADPATRANYEAFIRELAWREFYFAVLHHFPDVLEHEFDPQWRGVPWDEPGPQFDAWRHGLTGFPIVDAGMRELRATGFMHNRVRMITAMFLTKDLHVGWHHGESHFMQFLLDGEIASNNGGWQWSAGTGADAAPYFRIQNPWTQSLRYDPQGAYIKRWVPELSNAPARQLGTPPPAGSSVARAYPPPCVDHAAERLRTLAIFERHRQRAR